MNLAELFLGPSLTSPPLPPYYPTYARRFRSIARGLARLIFSKVRLHVQPEVRETMRHSKVVVYSNHPSWWDPIVFALLTGRLWPEHAVITPIDEAALRFHLYFHGLGFFGLAPSSAAGLRRFIEVANTCFEGPGDRCLAVTPEGRFSDGRRPLRLQRGLALALHGHQGPPLLAVPAAIGYRKGFLGRLEATLTVGEPLLLPSQAALTSVDPLHHELARRLEGALDDLEVHLMGGQPGHCLLSSP